MSLNLSQYHNASDEENEEFDIRVLRNSRFPSSRLEHLDISRSTRILSHFEGVPIEIRQEIYSYLGYPIAGKVWVDCAGPWNGHKLCTDPKHDCTGRRKTYRPWDYIWHQKGYETRVKLVEIPMSSYRLSLQSALGQKTVESKGTLQLNHYTEVALLGVCKSVRAECFSLLFGNIENKIWFVLYSNVVHTIKPFSSITRTIYSRSLFSLMTTMHLDSHIGQKWTAGGVWHPHASMSVGQILSKQADNLRFVATHCPNLRNLRFDAFLRGVVGEEAFRGLKGSKNPKNRLLEGILQGLMAVARKCEHIETVQLSGKNERNLMLPKERAGRHIIELKDVPSYMREEVTSEWAKGVLKELVKGNT